MHASQQPQRQRQKCAQVGNELEKTDSNNNNNNNRLRVVLVGGKLKFRLSFSVALSNRLRQSAAVAALRQNRGFLAKGATSYVVVHSTAMTRRSFAAVQVFEVKRAPPLPARAFSPVCLPRFSGFDSAPKPWSRCQMLAFD